MKSLALNIREGMIFRFLVAGAVWWGLGLLVINEAWAAGSISLSPATGTGSQFSVQVQVNTGGDPTIETDLILRYDPSVLQVSNVVFGNLYPENVHTIDSVSGTLSTFSYFSTSEPGDSFSGSGILATVEFTGLSPGSSAVTVSCTPAATNDSNIMREGTAQDILDCQQVVNGNYTVTAVATTPSPGVGLTTTPTATATPTRVTEIGSGNLSPTPTPVGELLESGALTPTLTLSVIGVMLLMSSLVLFIW